MDYELLHEISLIDKEIVKLERTKVDKDIIKELNAFKGKHKRPFKRSNFVPGSTKPTSRHDGVWRVAFLYAATTAEPSCRIVLNSETSVFALPV